MWWLRQNIGKIIRTNTCTNHNNVSRRISSFQNLLQNLLRKPTSLKLYAVRLYTIIRLIVSRRFFNSNIAIDGSCAAQRHDQLPLSLCSFILMMQFFNHNSKPHRCIPVIYVHTDPVRG